MDALLLHLLSAQIINAIRHPRRAKTVADQHYPVLSEKLKSNPHHLRMHVHPIRNELRKDLFTGDRGTDHAGIPMIQAAHCVIKMDSMTCTCPISRQCGRKIGIGMCEGNLHSSLCLPDKVFEAWILLRRQSDEFHKSARFFQKTGQHLLIAAQNILLILRPFLRMADKRTFHINSEKPCFSLFHPFFPISSC